MGCIDRNFGEAEAARSHHHSPYDPGEVLAVGDHTLEVDRSLAAGVDTHLLAVVAAAVVVGQELVPARAAFVQSKQQLQPPTPPVQPVCEASLPLVSFPWPRLVRRSLVIGLQETVSFSLQRRVLLVLPLSVIQ